MERIRITQGGNTLTIEKSGDKWLVKSQDGYPASAEKIRALLLALSDAKLLEPKTKVASRYAVLNVDDPAGKLSNARLIKVEDASGNTIRVRAGKKAKVSRSVLADAGDIHPGDTVVVTGRTADSGTLVATSVVATASNVDR